jgi:hypothetical protein
MRRVLRRLATFYRRACLTFAAVCFLLGWAAGAGAQTTVTDPLGLNETLSFQVFHNGVPVTGPTGITPQLDLGAPGTAQALSPVPEPSTWVLALTGAGLLAAGAAWRRRRA